MSGAEIFTLTSRFKEAIDTLNGITSAKFALVLSKLLTAVATKANAFNEAEQEQLVGVLNLVLEAHVVVTHSLTHAAHIRTTRLVCSRCWRRARSSSNKLFTINCRQRMLRERVGRRV
jgi:ribosomal protein S13